MPFFFVYRHTHTVQWSNRENNCDTTAPTRLIRMTNVFEKQDLAWLDKSNSDLWQSSCLHYRDQSHRLATHLYLQMSMGFLKSCNPHKASLNTSDNSSKLKEETTKTMLMLFIWCSSPRERPFLVLLIFNVWHD